MKTCLIVDDVTVSRFTSKAFLEPLGLEIYEADDEDSAVTVLENKNIDVILLDWHLRHKSGLDFLQTLRQSSKYKNLPVVMFSGVEGEENAQEALNAGANGFISKPTTKEKIEQVFSQIGIL